MLVLSLIVHVHGTKPKKSKVYSQCNGSTAECREENEMLMESETAQRILGEKRYISYGALNRDQPICGSPPGQAYSSNSGCLGHAANPYHRGCSKYYRCRSDT
ncbi:Protein RALF-like 32 [Bienertia sinuspersici]